MEREQFTFFSSFYIALRRIRKPAERCAAYDVICTYALTGELPDLDKLPDAAAIAFELIRPVLDSGKRKAESGRAGGKQSASKPEANGKQSASEGNPEAKPKREQTAREKEGEDEKEGEKEKENECSISPPAPSSPAPAAKPAAAGAMEMAKREFSGDLLTAVLDWLSYKRERREPYKEVGLRALFNQIRKAAETHGEAAVVEVIRNSMASGYMGITLDKLQNGAKRSAVTTAANYVPPKSSKEQIDFLQKILDEDRI